MIVKLLDNVFPNFQSEVRSPLQDIARILRAWENSYICIFKLSKSGKNLSSIQKLLIYISECCIHYQNAFDDDYRIASDSSTNRIESLWLSPDLARTQRRSRLLPSFNSQRCPRDSTWSDLWVDAICCEPAMRSWFCVAFQNRSLGMQGPSTYSYFLLARVEILLRRGFLLSGIKISSGSLVERRFFLARRIVFWVQYRIYI